MTTVRWTIKDGIVYDARQMMADVAKMVETQRVQRAANPKAAAQQDSLARAAAAADPDHVP